MNKITYKLQIKGIVQGVGFRPFVYKLALKYSLNGWVNNDDKGVNILIQNDEENCLYFINDLKNNPPGLAQIHEFNFKEITFLEEYNSFKIVESSNKNFKQTIISPDIAVCEDCLNDINDEKNFRLNYALTNCTNCGPRYSIIKTVPYDRVNTSMNEFIMCDDCKAEYTNPMNRRYHAQPIACVKCGPQIKLYKNNKEEIDSNLEAIKQSAKLINEGAIFAIKGMGGFHLVCNAKEDKSVQNLREKKSRKNKPFALMFKNLNTLNYYTNLSEKEKELLTSKEKPIVLVKKSSFYDLSPYIAPNIDRLGCFIAYTPLHYLLFRYLDSPIIATSANLKDEPICISKEEIFEKLGFIVDYILDFNRDIINACDDSIIQVVNNEIQVLRSARGYGPNTINLEKNFSKKVLALGANQKSTISLGLENNIITSPHIGDLNSLESIEFLQRNIKSFENFYDFKADVLVCDKHPFYESTKFAIALKEKNPSLQLIQIQHHYAHVLSCMAEYKLKEKVLAFAFDGTGFGDDGTIWGGEVFLCNNKEYERAFYVKNFKLLGGEKAVKEPKRIALSMLFENYSLVQVLKLDKSITKCFSENEIKLLHKMWENSLNSPKTSSFGRVFDAIAAFANLCMVQEYEGEAGLLIEQAYDNSIKDTYSYTIINKEIDLNPMIKELLEDEGARLISSKFINTIVKIIKELSLKYKDLSIVLTGGVFQNKTLLELVLKTLEGQKVYYSRKVPLNDAGVSIGQAYYLN